MEISQTITKDRERAKASNKNIKMFITQLFVLLSTKSVFQYQFCADDYIQMDPYQAL